MPDVQVEQISFNHADAKAGGSVSIKHAQGQPITAPEWRKGMTNPQDSLVAYAINQHKQNITLLVKLSNPSRSLSEVEVQGKADANNLLGDVQPAPVKFNPKGDPVVIPFTLASPKFSGVNEGVSEWLWQYRIKKKDDWTDIVTTKHQIYVLFDSPVEPWVRELPWVEVLDFSCKWARGARDDDEAASQIANEVYGLGEPAKKLVYYSRTATYAYEAFKCALFLKLLRTGTNAPSAVNCYDCASIVLTFSNILGAKLWELPMFPLIHTHYVKLIGEPKWDRTGFPFHAIAWKEEEDLVFDACLQVDRDGNPIDHCEFTATVPTNLPFTGKNNYKFCFFLSGLLIPQPQDKQRRPIGNDGFTGQDKVTDPVVLSLLKHNYEFEAWPADETEKEFQFDFVRSLVGSLAELPAFASWRFDDEELFKNEDVVGTRFFIKRGDVSTRNLVDVNLYVVPSARSSNDFILQVLGQFHKSDLKRETINTLGRLTFVEPCDLGVVFVRRNLVVFVRSVGKEKLAVFGLAQALDNFFASKIDKRKEDRIHG